MDLVNEYYKENYKYFDKDKFVKFRPFKMEDDNLIDDYFITLSVIPYYDDDVMDYAIAIEDVTSDMAKELNNVLGSEFKCKVGRDFATDEDWIYITTYRIKEAKSKEEKEE